MNGVIEINFVRQCPCRTVDCIFTSVTCTEASALWLWDGSEGTLLPPPPRSLAAVMSREPTTTSRVIYAQYALSLTPADSHTHAEIVFSMYVQPLLHTPIFPPPMSHSAKRNVPKHIAGNASSAVDPCVAYIIDFVRC